MTFRNSLRLAAQAARANLLPGVLLQAMMVVFLTVYLASDEARHAFARLALLKHEAGYAFGFGSYVFASALLPEVLRVVFFQSGRIRVANLRNFAVCAPFWGIDGMVVDMFYRHQAIWFGTGNDWRTLVAKVVVDQFLYSPFFSSPMIVGFYAWKDMGFRGSALRGIIGLRFYLEKVLPVQIAGWCVWIPSVSLVYFMPSDLQVPTAVLIQCFWVLLLMTLDERLKFGRTSGSHR